jgi:CRP/FNR family transcriptional regulator, cyclic AMP receptor protein
LGVVGVAVRVDDDGGVEILGRRNRRRVAELFGGRIMAVDHKIEVLETVGLFAGCTKKELQTIGRLCTPMSVDDGFVLTTQGGPGGECFVIGAGEATVTIDGRAVAEVGPGEPVGEMSLLDGGRRTATVTATTPMSVYVLSRAEFTSLLAQNPTIDRKIMTILARRLRAAETDRPH